jgi:hypothetical protein
MFRSPTGICVGEVKKAGAAPSDEMLKGGPPTSIYRLRGSGSEPDIILKYEDIFVLASDDRFPRLDMRSSDGDLLTRHPDGLTGVEGCRELGIRLNEQLVADSILGVNVAGRGNGATVTSIYSRKSPANRSKCHAVGRSEAAQFLEHSPPSLGLSVQVDNYDRPNAARSGAKGGQSTCAREKRDGTPDPKGHRA